MSSLSTAHQSGSRQKQLALYPKELTEFTLWDILNEHVWSRPRTSDRLFSCSNLIALGTASQRTAIASTMTSRRCVLRARDWTANSSRFEACFTSSGGNWREYSIEFGYGWLGRLEASQERARVRLRNLIHFFETFRIQGQL